MWLLAAPGMLTGLSRQVYCCPQLPQHRRACWRCGCLGALAAAAQVHSRCAAAGCGCCWRGWVVEGAAGPAMHSAQVICATTETRSGSAEARSAAHSTASCQTQYAFPVFETPRPVRTKQCGSTQHPEGATQGLKTECRKYVDTHQKCSGG